MNPKRLYGLDFLKIFAIIWICLYHFLDYRNGWGLGAYFDKGELLQFFASDGILFAIPKLIASMGGIGVHIFIIASGLGLALSVRGGDLKLLEFFKKRVFKILPLYWALLAIILILSIIKGSSINYLDYATHFLGIHTFFPDFTYSISTPLWFIGVIIQLYLLFPILYKLIKKIHPIIIILGAIVIQIFLNTFFVQLFDGGRFFTEFILSFVAGIYLGNLISKDKIKFNLQKSILLIIFGVFGMVALIFKTKLQIPADIIGLMFSFISISIFIGIFNIFNSKSNFFIPNLPEGSLCYADITKKALIFLATISYPLYLTHYLVLTHILPKLPQLPFVLEMILFLILAFILSLYSFLLKFILQISIKYGKL